MNTPQEIAAASREAGSRQDGSWQAATTPNATAAKFTNQMIPKE